MARLILLGTGAAGTPPSPAGLLLEYGRIRLGFDGGPGSEPPETVHAWLISDPFDPLQPERRRLAHLTGMPDPAVSPYDHGPLRVEPLPLAGHAYGYRITAGTRTAVWAPHAPSFPPWAANADLMFAPASVSTPARASGVRRLILTSPAEAPHPYAEQGEPGRTYRF